MSATQRPGAREQVTAFSRWERELPKLLGDPRFGAVASTKDRRALFDHFCKEVGTAARAGSKPGKEGALSKCPAHMKTFMTRSLPASRDLWHLAQRRNTKPSVIAVCKALYRGASALNRPAAGET